MNTLPTPTLRRRALHRLACVVLLALARPMILADRPHPEQGFRACLGIVRLGRSFGRDRVNAACARALEIGARTYGSVRSILDNHLDRTASSNGAASH